MKEFVVGELIFLLLKIYDVAIHYRGRNLSTLNNEGGGEILFERQTKFRYIDLSRKNGKIYIRLEKIE